jgi:hypothetical protein
MVWLTSELSSHIVSYASAVRYTKSYSRLKSIRDTHAPHFHLATENIQAKEVDVAYNDLCAHFLPRLFYSSSQITRSKYGRYSFATKKIQQYTVVLAPGNRTNNQGSSMVTAQLNHQASNSGLETVRPVPRLQLLIYRGLNRADANHQMDSFQYIIDIEPKNLLSFLPHNKNNTPELHQHPLSPVLQAHSMKS